MLRIQDLRVSFPNGDSIITPVDGIDITVTANETFTILGESGCGKSLLALSVLRLLPGDAMMSGNIYFHGSDLTEMSERDLREIRGSKIGLVFQNSATSIDPVFTLRSQLKEVVGVEEAEELLRAVNIPDPERRLSQYPHHLSGGMKQRVAVAFGIAQDPELLIADEPTTGLDVSVKVQLVNMLEKVHKDRSILLITHDLDVAAYLADRIAVMYAGEIVEIAFSADFFSGPLHPYASMLLDSHPDRGMVPIPGSAPPIIDLPRGCRFHSRCNRAVPACFDERPPMVRLDNNRAVKCFLYE